MEVRKNSPGMWPRLGQTFQSLVIFEDVRLESRKDKDGKLTCTHEDMDKCLLQREKYETPCFLESHMSTVCIKHIDSYCTILAKGSYIIIFYSYFRRLVILQKIVTLLIYVHN